MANTYTQIFVHVVFAVKNRQSLINDDWADELYQYISGIVRNQEHKLLAINGMPDHVHMLIGLSPVQSISDLMQDVKGDSSRWINSKGLVKGKFSWQQGYGAFSYAKSQVPVVAGYIERQKDHHRKRPFAEEYREILLRFGVEYDERYLFKPLDEDRESQP